MAVSREEAKRFVYEALVKSLKISFRMKIDKRL